MPVKSNISYFKAIGQAIGTTLGGAKLTLTHLKDAILRPKSPATNVDDENYFEQQNKGIVTLRYPIEKLPTPHNARYQLHNEIDDCIVCDKCAKICPVDCIDIEPIKSPEVIGHTSDGTAKRLYAAKFDIDMAKCCFCGLCTTVCPTECLTMTNEYDFSTFDVGEMNFEFAEMTPEEVAEKQRIYDEAQAAKKIAALAKAQEVSTDKPTTKVKPSFRPKLKTATVAPEDGEMKKKPVFKPKVKPSVEEAKGNEENKPSSEAKPKPKFRPKMKTAKPAEEKADLPEKEPTDEPAAEEKPKPKFRPKIRPKINKKPPETEE